jgi:hypothetical protein
MMRGWDLSNWTMRNFQTKTLHYGMYVYFLYIFSPNKVRIILYLNLATCLQLRSAIRVYKVHKDWTGYSWQNTLYKCNTHSPLIGISRCFLSCAGSIFMVSMSTAVIVNIQGPYFVWQLSCCHFPLWLHHVCGISAEWDLLILWTSFQEVVTCSYKMKQWPCIIA